MPYELQQSDGGWYVVTQGSGRKHSRRPLSRARAVAQMRALYASNPEARTKEAGHTGVMLAFFIPPAALPAVTALQEGLPNPEPEEDLHLTLAYLGDSAAIAEQRSFIEGMLSSIDWVAFGLPLAGTVGGIGRFHHDEGNGTNAVYASVDSPALPAFRQFLVDALSSAGIPYAQNHGFTPHITLAYVPTDADIPTLPPPELSEVTFGILTLAWGDERINYGPATMATKANYGARAGETIAGRLARGGDGKFTAAGSAEPEKPAEKPTPRRQKLGRTAAARAEAKRARRAAKPKKGTAPKKAAAPKKGGGGSAKVDPAKREEERKQRQAQQDQEKRERQAKQDQERRDRQTAQDAERRTRQAQQDQEKRDRQTAQDTERRTRQAQQDQERHDRQAAQDAASERRATEREARQAAREERRERARLAKEAAKSAKGGGGSKQPAPKPDRDAAQAEKRTANRAVVSSVVGATGVAPDAVTALAAFADGATPDTSTDLGRQMQAQLEALEPLGLVERDSTGGLRLAEQGRQFMRAADTGNARGALDALSRGRDQARKRQSQKALTVFKDARGRYRWLTFSSTSFQDRDREIVSTKALSDDVARADRDGDYGPLRWWHMPGVDIGDCDWNAMSGRTLIESGTFRDERYGPLVAAKAADLGVSIGFLHPRHEPDQERVFHSIRRFERSLVPLPYPSNPYTAVVVKESTAVDATKIAGLKALGFDDEMIASIQEQAATREKSAEQAGVAFKADEPPADAPADDAAADDAADMVYVGDMGVDEYRAAFVQPVVDAIGALAGAISGQATTKEATDQATATALKAATDQLAATTQRVAGLEEQLNAARTELEATAKTVKELSGEVPAGVVRASQADATIVPDGHALKNVKPEADPLNDFVNSFIVSGAAAG